MSVLVLGDPTDAGQAASTFPWSFLACLCKVSMDSLHQSFPGWETFKPWFPEVQAGTAPPHAHFQQWGAWRSCLRQWLGRRVPARVPLVPTAGSRGGTTHTQLTWVSWHLKMCFVTTAFFLWLTKKLKIAYIYSAMTCFEERIHGEVAKLS